MIDWLENSYLKRQRIEASPVAVWTSASTEAIIQFAFSIRWCSFSAKPNYAKGGIPSKYDFFSALQFAFSFFLQGTNFRARNLTAIFSRFFGHNDNWYQKKKSLWRTSFWVWTYPTVVIEMKDHQNPCPAPLMNWRGKCSGLALESCQWSKHACMKRWHHFYNKCLNSHALIC